MVWSIGVGWVVTVADPPALRYLSLPMRPLRTAPLNRLFNRLFENGPQGAF